MSAHLINGKFQSDKFPTTPAGLVPLSVKDVTAQDLLWEYAQRRRSVDAEFSDDLETALRAAGFVPPYSEADYARDVREDNSAHLFGKRRCKQCGKLTRVTTAGCDHCDDEDK